MRFKSHSALQGSHAFLSPSKYHWVNYDTDKLERSYENALAAQRGTELHELAHRMIQLRVKLPDVRKTLNLYVNDCIGFRMVSEQMLFYSVNAFGTADAISFRDGVLRISDLKTGQNKVSETQLEVLAALFCLEYKYKPIELSKIELRIYQSNDVILYPGDYDRITHIMSKIVVFDKHISKIREEVL